MRWGVALCVVCAAVAALTGGSLAQVADEEEDDDDPPAAAGTSFRSWSLFDPPGPSAPPFDFLTGGMPDRMLYFSGVEAQRWGLAAYAGAQWAPARIDRDGFILRMLMSDSLNRFTKAKHRTDTQILRGAVLPGYKFSYRTFELQVLAGVGSELDVKSAKGSATGWQVKFGAQVVADLWWEPSRDWMVAAGVGRRAVHLGRVLAGEGPAAVGRGAAVRVDDDLAAGQAGVAVQVVDPAARRRRHKRTHRLGVQA
eukprot:gene40592-54887_t